MGTALNPTEPGSASGGGGPLWASTPAVMSGLNVSVTVLRLTPNRKLIDEKVPHIEGITLNGDLKVIYSPFDLEAGWQGMEHPLAKAYEPEGAMQLGMNIVMYSVTH